MKKLNYTLMYVEENFMKYYTNDSIIDELEIHFDNGQFNGTVLYCTHERNAEGYPEFKVLNDKAIYDQITEIAINDYINKNNISL